MTRRRVPDRAGATLSKNAGDRNSIIVRYKDKAHDKRTAAGNIQEFKRADIPYKLIKSRTTRGLYLARPKEANRSLYAVCGKRCSQLYLIEGGASSKFNYKAGGSLANNFYLKISDPFLEIGKPDNVAERSVREKKHDYARP